jgi:hypothetical protein
MKKFNDDETEILRITNVSANLKKDLILIAQKKSYSNLSAFIKAQLRQVANVALEELNLKKHE